MAKYFQYFVHLQEYHMQTGAIVDSIQASLEREREWGLPHENLGSYLETKKAIIETVDFLATGKTPGLGKCMETDGFAKPIVIVEPFGQDDKEVFFAATTALHRLRLRNIYQQMTRAQFAQWCWLDEEFFQVCTALYTEDCEHLKGWHDSLLLNSHISVLRRAARSSSVQVTEEQEGDFCQVAEKREEEVPEVVFSEQDWLAAEKRARARLLCYLRHIML